MNSVLTGGENRLWGCSGSGAGLFCVVKRDGWTGERVGTVWVGAAVVSGVMGTDPALGTCGKAAVGTA